jgi:F0F1-type ATP synthase assembly protein I
MENKKENWWQKPVLLFAELSSWIAFPVLMAVFIGKWLDQRYGTKPWLFLVTVAVAFVISTIGIVKNAVKNIKSIEQEEKNNNKDK